MLVDEVSQMAKEVALVFDQSAPSDSVSSDLRSSTASIDSGTLGEEHTADLILTLAHSPSPNARDTF